MKKTKFFNLIPDGDTCTILLFGYIGEYDQIRSADVTRELLEASKKYQTIIIRLNSPGGEVYTGIAIFNALRNTEVEVKIYVDGIAASMGSVLALCGRHVEMSKYAKLMLHGVSGGCYGNRKDLEKYLEMMDNLEATLCQMLSEKCGKSPEELRATYFDGQDHWLTAEEALALGFIDGIYDADPVTVPENCSPEEAFAVFNNKYENSLNQEEMFEKLKKMASFANCADEAAVMTRIAEVTAAADKVPTLEKEKEALEKERDDLQEKVDAHEKEKKEAHAQAIEDILDEAIEAEKFGADAREGYHAMLTANFEKGKAVIDGMPKKRLAVEDIDKGDKTPKKGPMEARLEEIQNNSKK